MSEAVNEILYENQRLYVDKVPNIRQLGGYIGAGGRTVKKNMLIRSGHLSNITEEGLKLLSEKYNVRAVIDFRIEVERKFKPDKQLAGSENFWLPIISPNEDVGKIKNTVEQMYSDEALFLNTIIGFAEKRSALTLYKGFISSEQAQKGFAEFFKILLNNDDGAVLWHCTQGKDRTGLAAALLLYALGVDRETILRDYELSLDYYSKEVLFVENEIRKIGGSEELIRNAKSLIGVDKEYLELALQFIDKEYGSISDYLNNQLGISDEDIKILQNKYLS